VLAVFVHLGLLWFFSIVLRLLGAFLVGFSLTATFLNSVYDVVEAEDRPQDHLPPPESAASWKEREQLEKAHEERRMNSLRYRRTMRDILRPWED
jgi:hypothetical protein